MILLIRNVLVRRELLHLLLRGFGREARLFTLLHEFLVSLVCKLTNEWGLKQAVHNLAHLARLSVLHDVGSFNLISGLERGLALFNLNFIVRRCRGLRPLLLFGLFLGLMALWIGLLWGVDFDLDILVGLSVSHGGLGIPDLILYFALYSLQVGRCLPLSGTHSLRHAILLVLSTDVVRLRLLELVRRGLWFQIELVLRGDASWWRVLHHDGGVVLSAAGGCCVIESLSVDIFFIVNLSLIHI